MLMRVEELREETNLLVHISLLGKMMELAQRKEVQMEYRTLRMKFMIGE